VACDSTPIRQKHNLSCPTGGECSTVSGTGSMEWLNDHNNDDASVVFLQKRRLRSEASHKEIIVKILIKGPKKNRWVTSSYNENLEKRWLAYQERIVKRSLRF